MSNINFTGNPQQAAAAAGGLLALIASAPAWAIVGGVAAVAGVTAYAVKKSNEKKGK